ncbi:major facilitator superfamily domain-containing protein, partial [Cladochytrium replicatum]
SLLRRSSSFGGAPIVVVKTLDGDDGWVEGSGEPCARGPPPWLRWVVLFLSCLLLYGNYYAYDLPAALNIPLQEYLQHDYDQYQFELNLLYTVYSVPNIVLPFVGGHLVDTLDPRLVLLGFSAFVCLGQTIFAIGVVTKNFGVMLVGRGVFGIGGECISVVQAAITTQWFRGKEVAFALGLNLCIARLGSVSNTILSPRIASRFSVPAAIWAGSLTCYLSLCASLTLASVMTMYTYNMRGKAPANNAEVQSPSSSEVSSPQPSFDPNDPASQVEEPSSAESTPLLFKQHTPKQHSCPLLFPASFYLICVICVLLYGTVIPFNNIASDFLTSKYFPGDVAHANLMMSIPDTLSAFLVPPCGYLLDRYGRRVTALLASALAITLVHLTLGLTTTIHPAYPLILLGFAYSFYGCAIWPSVAIAVAHSAEHVESIGTAYGVSTSALNAALSVFPMIAAGVLVRTGGFVGVEMFFAGLAGAGAVVSFVLWEVDRRNGGFLEAPEL